MNNNTSNKPRSLGPGFQYLLDYLKRMQAENPDFFYATENDTEQCGNVFWADSISRTNYTFFGDTVRVDTSYRMNRRRIPLITFSGLNHHARPVLFGCALLLKESENSFAWLFQTWLGAMSGQTPVSITIEPDRLVQTAAARIFPPQTRTRLCRWSIFRQTQHKLTNVCQVDPTFNHELKKCVNEADSAEEFESCWESLLARYYLMENEWFRSLYSVRDQWVPVYLRDSFFGDLFAVDRDESFFLDEFSGTSAATTVQSWIREYEKAVASWQEKESRDDFDTLHTNPILKTPSPMEKQAAGLYTRRIFVKFQDELVETLANPARMLDESGGVITYRVAKFGEELKAHTVRFCDGKAACSCRMFEFSGIICRHVLSVFRAKNVLMLPHEYVLRRWTRNAKASAGDCGPGSGAFGLTGNCRESQVVRASNLRREAMKYVEEGAKSIRVYNVAMNALQEASKKVASVKSKYAGTLKGTSEANGGNHKMHATENELSSYLPKEEKEKKIQELTADLQRTNQRCEVYRTILQALFRDVEDEKLKLSVKVQNARLSLKE